MAVDLPDREILLGGWLHTNETCMLWSQSGTGKSWVALDMAITVACGGSMGPWKADGNRKVLIVDGEMGPHDLQRRFKKLLALKTPEQQAMAKKNIILLPRTYGQKPDMPFVCLTQREHRSALIRDVLELAPDLVILDNYSTLTLGYDAVDENDAGQAGYMNEMVLKLKSAGVAVLMVHHSGKGGDTFRGSSAMVAVFDYVIGLTRPEDVELPRNRASFVMEFGKDRSGNPDATAKATWILSEFGWNVQSSAADRAKHAVELLKTLRYPTQEALAADMNTSTSTLSRIFKDARERDLISKAQTARYFKEAVAILDQTEDDPEGEAEDLTVYTPDPLDDY